MNQIQLVKQRVCIAILTVGLSLAALGEFGCSPEQNQMVDSSDNKVNQLVVVRG